MLKKRIGIAFLIILLVSVFCLPIQGGLALAEEPGEITVLIDNQPLDLEVAPRVVGGRTLVPLRAIFEALGASVQWEPADQSITATKGDLTLKLVIGRSTGFKNGTPVTLDTPPQIVDGRTLVPLRFVSENLGAQVGWDGNARQVSIGTADMPGAANPTAIGMKIDPAKIHDVVGNAHNQFNQLTKVNKLSPAEALNQQMASLRQQPDVELVEQLPDSCNLLVRFKDGYDLVMLQGDENTRGGLTPSTSLTIPKIVTSPTIVPNSGTMSTITTPGITINPPAATLGTVIPEDEPELPPEPVEGVASSLDPSLLATNDIQMDDVDIDPRGLVLTGINAVIFDTLADDPHEMPELGSKISEQLEGMGYHTDIYSNDEANLSRLAEIDAYNLGVMVVSSHGCVVGSDYFFSTRPWYDNPPPADSGYTGTRVFSAYNGATKRVQYHYAVGSEFAQTYWTSRFPGTMFMLEACQGGMPQGRPGLPTWALRHGASAWYGWTGNVTFENGDRGTLAFFKSLKLWHTFRESQADANIYDCGSCRLFCLYNNSFDNYLDHKLPNLYWDERESGDGRDFVLVKLEEYATQLLVQVYFSDTYSSTDFCLYFDNNGDGLTDTTVQCTPGAYRIYSNSSYPPRLLGTGAPSINDCLYSMDLSCNTLFGYGRPPKFYLSEWSGGTEGDRMPDSGWLTGSEITIRPAIPVQGSSTVLNPGPPDINGPSVPGTLEPPKQLINWTGRWDTNFGILVLTQDGTRVTGTYPNGTLTGTASYSASGINTLTGTFDEGGGYTGPFTFTMSADGKYFTGTWHYDGGENNTWNGTRITN